mmetsp:Transcript_23045/g.71772  ORF Transcript_23045/g.71772 Transcript_23045/m.71772 type:complete len:280 (+) Transcript_23045:4713-5552(+)
MVFVLLILAVEFLEELQRALRVLVRAGVLVHPELHELREVEGADPRFALGALVELVEQQGLLAILIRLVEALAVGGAPRGPEAREQNFVDGAPLVLLEGARTRVLGPRARAQKGVHLNLLAALLPEARRRPRRVRPVAARHLVAALALRILLEQPRLVVEALQELPHVHLDLREVREVCRHDALCLARRDLKFLQVYGQVLRQEHLRRLVRLDPGIEVRVRGHVEQDPALLVHSREALEAVLHVVAAHLLGRRLHVIDEVVDLFQVRGLARRFEARVER